MEWKEVTPDFYVLKLKELPIRAFVERFDKRWRFRIYINDQLREESKEEMSGWIAYKTAQRVAVDEIKHFLEEVKKSLPL